MPTAFDFDATTIDGQPLQLQDLKGKTLLVVNTASALAVLTTSSVLPLRSCSCKGWPSMVVASKSKAVGMRSPCGWEK